MNAIKKQLMTMKFPYYSTSGPYFYMVLNSRESLVVANVEFCYESGSIQDSELALRPGTKPCTRKMFDIAQKRVTKILADKKKQAESAAKKEPKPKNLTEKSSRNGTRK